MTTLFKVNYSKIYAFSETGLYNEFDTLEQALNYKSFVVVRLQYGNLTSENTSYQYVYNLIETETEDRIIRNAWSYKFLLLNGDRSNHRISYRIIDRNGIVRHFYSVTAGLDGLGESFVYFLQTSKYSDWNDFDIYAREQKFKEEKENLQNQINQLKEEIRQLKEVVGK